MHFFATLIQIGLYPSAGQWIEMFKGNVMIYGIILRLVAEVYSDASQRKNELFFNRINIRIVLSK